MSKKFIELNKEDYYVRITPTLKKEFKRLSESNTINIFDFIKMIIKQKFYRDKLQIAYETSLEQILLLKTIMPNFNKLISKFMEGN